MADSAKKRRTPVGVVRLASEDFRRAFTEVYRHRAIVDSLIRRSVNATDKSSERFHRQTRWAFTWALRDMLEALR